MDKVLIDKFYQKVKSGNIPLNEIPKPYRSEVQRLLDGVKKVPKEDVEINLGEFALLKKENDLLKRQAKTTANILDYHEDIMQEVILASLK